MKNATPDPITPSDPPVLEPRLDIFRRCVTPAVVRIDELPRQGAVCLVTNDYLALADHPEIVHAQVQAALGGSSSLWMSAVFFGDDAPQRRAECRFAAFLRTEDAMICQSGYAANLGLMQAIAGPGTDVYIDACAHASLWHGIQASGATPQRFKHNDSVSLERLLERGKPGIVVVDSIYSHDGSVCPLDEMVELAGRHGSVIVVDESHSLGTHGPEGSGLVAAHGLEHRVHFRTASLAKAFVGRAGLIACSRRLGELVRYSSGPSIFSSSCMDHDFRGLLAALSLIRRADDRRELLRLNADYLRTRLSDVGYDVSAGRSQIIALVAGDDARTIALRQALEAHGVYGSGFCPPATRVNHSLVRLSVNAGLTREQLDRVVEACRFALHTIVRDPGGRDDCMHVRH
jgi:CAI-1 autoinducer synthase